MKKPFITALLVVTTGILPLFTHANEIDLKKADELVKKYNTRYERPKSCPMESKNLAEILAKTEAIKDVLKGNCKRKDEDKMTEILESIKGIQDELKDKTDESSRMFTEVWDDLTGGEEGVKTVNGLKFSAVFSNLTNMIKNNQCSMEDGRVLEMTADLIYDSTQLGILAGTQTGLIVAGGGFLISSALRLIDLMIKQKFNFDKTSDRQSFIKLNCTFYDVRRELELQGILDIENTTGREDFRDVKYIMEQLATEIRKIEAEKANIEKENSDIDRQVIAEEIGDLTPIKSAFTKVHDYLKVGLSEEHEMPTETQKLLMISQLAQDHALLLKSISHYKQLNISTIPLLDDLFIQELNRFDPHGISFTETMSIGAKEFNEKHRAQILFHLIRITKDIAVKEKSFEAKTKDLKKKLAFELESKRYEFIKKYKDLKQVEVRLGSLISPRHYSGLDDGSDNLVSILENHKHISAQIYGEWGQKFLKYTTEKSYDEVKLFNGRFGSFEKKYDIGRFEKSRIDLATSHVCQDAQRLRLVYRLADSLSQAGYDFVVTNRDLIYSDVKNKYNIKMNEDDNYNTFLGDHERMQRHYKSASYALRHLNGDQLDKDIVDTYLSRKWGKSYFIGYSMIEVAGIQEKSRQVQDIYERAGCQRSFSEDLGI